MGVKSTSGNHDNVLKADGHLLEFLRSSFGFGGGGTNFSGVAAPGITASGGVISDYTSGSDLYRAHVFTSSGTHAEVMLFKGVALFLLIYPRKLHARVCAP